MPSIVFALVRVYLGIGAFQIDWAQNARRAMPGTSQEDRVKIVLLDEAVEMNISEAQTRT